MKRGIATLAGIALLFTTAGLVAASGATAPKADEGKKAAGTAATAKKQHTAVGTVKSAAEDGLVVVTKVKGKDAEKTFAVDDKVKIRKGGKDITLKDVTPGDKVTVRYTDGGGTMTAVSVNVATRQAARADAPKGAATKK